MASKMITTTTKSIRKTPLQFLEAAPVEIPQWIVSDQTFSHTIFELLRSALFLWFGWTIGIESFPWCPGFFFLKKGKKNTLSKRFVVCNNRYKFRRIFGVGMGMFKKRKRERLIYLVSPEVPPTSYHRMQWYKMACSSIVRNAYPLRSWLLHILHIDSRSLGTQPQF